MQVPEGWKIEKLSNLTSKIGSGSTPNGGEKSYKTKGIKLIRSQNVLWGKTDLSNVAYIDNKQNKQMQNSIVLKDDVLLNITGASIGRCAIYSSIHEANVNQHVCILRPTNQLLSQYLMYSLLSFNGQKQIEQFQAGGNRQGLNFKQIGGIKIHLPSVREQQKIIEVLLTWDKAISTTELLLTNSQQQKKALMQQLLTGKKRLLDKNGVRFSGEWKLDYLSNATTIVMGSSPKSEAYNKNSIGLPLLQGNADIKNRKSAPRVYTSEITKECEIGDILISVRAPVGNIALSEHKACIGRGIAALKVKRTFNQGFIYQWLLWFEPKWRSFSQGSTFESINSDDIRNLEIKLPELEEQKKIAAVLSAADQEISVLQHKLDTLEQEKKALMQQLLIGKRKVT